MTRLFLPLLAAVLLTGCEAVNETLVRQLFLDRGLSGEVNARIRQGYQRRMALPPTRPPQQPAPAFLDQG